MRNRSLLGVALAAYVGLLVWSLFVAPWLVMAINGVQAKAWPHMLEVCAEGACMTRYELFEGGFRIGVLEIATIGLAGLVLARGVPCALGGVGVDNRKLGYGLGGTALLVNVWVAIDAGGISLSEVSAAFDVSARGTSSPWLLAASHVVGMVVLAQVASLGADAADAPRVAPAPLAPAAARYVARRPGAGTAPPPTLAHADEPPAESPGRPGRITAAPPPPQPPHLRGALRYALRSLELSRAGVDARTEAGASRLVLWADVVGVVARTLPPAHGDHVLVDVVSTPENTVRILPWTLVMGEGVAGTGEDRARALIQLVTTRAPHAKLDAATREFVAGAAPARRLPDAAALAEHDARLA